MASMTRIQRATKFVKQLKESMDLSADASKILNELNSLVLTESKEPLSLEEKIAILEEAKKIIRYGKKIEGLERLKEAGDNSALIEIIDAIESEIKEED